MCLYVLSISRISHRISRQFTTLVAAAAIQSDETSRVVSSNQVIERMLNPKLSATLKHAGYGLVGNHSAVKICRWTKRQLQGRGGCYKHTFYGIESHRCMETTTFLACANRCVFCWRHHTHPVAKDFSRWKPDPPDVLFNSAISQHQLMIKPLRGIPGASPERYKEAMNPRHCALSLVGEPIVYPYINEFINLLHSNHISSFLVTNGQHPEAIANLTTPVTQLYLSLDAPNPQIMKKIGRPLFKDYWDRFLASLDLLSHRKERTVARLTLVREWNDQELQGYADLIGRGQPDFIEVKGFTYPGPTRSIEEAGLRMTNCPQAHDIITFAQKLEALLSHRQTRKEWEIASTHLHSNSVLLASTCFKKKILNTSDNDAAAANAWNIWIDFEQFANFSKLIQDKNDDFKNGHDEFWLKFRTRYSKEAPDWTRPDSELGGFDPQFDVERWKIQMARRLETATKTD